jgi:structural maintenance of chromosome 3 (chondroitin sulfate proteoglycan 6)
MLIVDDVILTAIALLTCLVQVVVQSDEVGLRLVRMLNQRGRGRVTFMPLNKLHLPDIAYPKQFGSDAVPLYKHLKTDQRFTRAVQQVSLPPLPASQLAPHAASAQASETAVHHTNCL